MKRKDIIKILRAPLLLLYNIYALVLFLVLMVPIFICSLLATTFGRIRGGNLVYKACTVWADIWCFLIFIHHKNIYKQPLKKGKSYIFIANHISYLDAVIILKMFRVPVRPLGKVELTKIPLFGFIYKYVIVTVDRSSVTNRFKSVQLLKSILKKGISVVVFPEGTFNTTNKPLLDFYDGAFRIAIETGTPIKPVLLLDTFKRMHYNSVFSLTRGKSRSIFLEEVDVNGLTLQDVSALKEKVYQLMEAALIEYRAPWITEDVNS